MILIHGEDEMCVGLWRGVDWVPLRNYLLIFSNLEE